MTVLNPKYPRLSSGDTINHGPHTGIMSFVFISEYNNHYTTDLKERSKVKAEGYSSPEA